MKEFLEAGRVVGTHGIRGEIRFEAWMDTPDFFRNIKTLYLDESTPFDVLSARAHKSLQLLLLSGVDSVEKAMALRNKIFFIRRSEIALPEGSYFIQDILGFEVYDRRTRTVIGTLKNFSSMPSGRLYVVSSQDKKEYLIPEVPEFVKKVDFERSVIEVSTIEGMCQNEN